MKPTERFSDRVSNYLEYRPSYPAELVNTLITECGLTQDSVVADVGSGTGKFTDLLLRNNLQVFGVEPNKEMREAAEDLFTGNPKFSSVSGESCHTSLNANSVDLVTAAQSFHWFEPQATKEEFRRILRPEGSVALIWNKRDIDTEFQRDYDAMLARYCPDYTNLHHHNILDADIDKFNSPFAVRTFWFPYVQELNLSGFIGRMCSASYTPKAETKEHESLVDAAKVLYKTYAQNGRVEFAYKTTLYLAHLH